MILVSLVIPCFNAVDKIGRCLYSLEKINFSSGSIEVIFVDDCSSDGTDSLLRRECSHKRNWHFIKLENNSGSPSKPRNLAIEKAKGKYIYFLDCDDEIIPEALQELYELAEKKSACLVRSELLVDNGKERKLMNQLSDWCSELTLKERIELIVSKQSTVVTSFVKRSLLLDNNIKWPEDLRMGEDTVFLARVMNCAKNIEFLSKPTFIYYKLPSLMPSSTQRYGAKELSDHLEVWEVTHSLLSHKGVSYIETRLQVGIKAALESLIHKSRGDLDYEVFDKFHAFLKKYWNTVEKMTLSNRLKQILRATKNNDYESFSELIKPRLLIAGHDLKFICDAVPKLEECFTIRTDVWKGHEIHDEAESKKHIEWAEYIWCEWLLGNAEWYAKHKKKEQKLVVRMHRMELSRVHGEKIKMDAVDAVVSISPFFFERMLERFPNIPRDKARLVYNYVQVDDYESSKSDEKYYTLGMIGILPSKKGLKDALLILRDLRKRNSRYNLKIFGKQPSELHWIAKDPVEIAYFDECERIIKDNGLQKNVEYVGHVDIKKALAEHNVGYVLSLSETELGFPGFESFHLAVADGFCSGAVSLIKHWPGAEMVWPSDYIFNTNDEIVDHVVFLSDNNDEYARYSEKGKLYIKSKYDMSSFIASVRKIYLEVS